MAARRPARTPQRTVQKRIASGQRRRGEAVAAMN